MPSLEIIEHKTLSGQQGAEKVCTLSSHKEQCDHREAEDD